MMALNALAAWSSGMLSAKAFKTLFKCLICLACVSCARRIAKNQPDTPTITPPITLAMTPMISVSINTGAWMRFRALRPFAVADGRCSRRKEAKRLAIRLVETV